MAKIKGTAYASDDDAADLLTGKGNGQPVVREQKKTAGKNVSVKFLDMVRGSYGAFNRGDVAEIDAKLAEEFKAAGICEPYTAPSRAADEDED